MLPLFYTVCFAEILRTTAVVCWVYSVIQGLLIINFLLYISDIKLDLNDHGERETTDDKIHRKQSFVRGETKRRVICHRRTPSAPTTPRHDGQDSSSSCNDVDDVLGQQYPERDKSVSQPVLDGALCSKPPHGAGRSSSSVRHDSESERFYVESLVPDSAFIRNGEENSSEKRKGSKTPPKDRKKLKEAKDNSPQMEGKVARGDRGRRGSDKENISDFSIKQGSGLIAELPESPGSRRKLWTSSTSKSEDHGAVSNKYFYSRFHDYAEIDDDHIDSGNQIVNRDNTQKYGSESSLRSSGENRTQPSLESRRSYHVESIDSVLCESHTKTEKTEFQVSSRKNSRTYSSSESVSSTHSGRKYIAHEELLAEISDLEKGLQNMQKSNKKGGRKPMTKCVSIPSDIQRSIDNIRSASGSHSDLMSSVTISELSVSQDNVSEDPLTLDRRRRSTSMDALNDESPLSRTLREINAQIDKAFKHEKSKTQSLRELQCSPQTPTGSAYELESELVSYEEELAETPTGHRTFSSMRDVMESPSAYYRDTTLAGSVTPTEHNQNKFVDRPVAETHVVSAPQVIRAPLRFNKGAPSPIQTTQPTPTRPSPPASLDIVSNIQQSGHSVIVTEIKNSDTSLHQNVQSKTDFKLSEEDFQKLLMSDPESMKQFEQSMMYSPVRSRNCSNRASVASPVEGVIPRLRSNRSSLTSPEASPIAFPRQPHNRSFGSPEVSPQSLRHHRHVSSTEASPQSARQQRVLSSTESSPSSGCKYKHNQSFSSSEVSPQAVRQRLSQSYSSSDSPQSNRQKLNSSLSSCEASPHSSRQKLNQGHSSSEASPQVGARDKHNISFSSSTENSPQPTGRKLGQYRTGSPQFTKSSPQTRHESKTIGSPLQDKRTVQESPKFDTRKSSSAVSSPLSPEHKQPRWEDLACLNDSFNELDLAVFNDNWKKCLAPTGDSIRLSRNTDSREVLNSHIDFPEVSTATDTVVLERPSITRKSIPERGKSLETRSPEIEIYDNVPEHESFRLAQEAKTNKGVQRDRPFLQRSHTAPSDTSLPQSPTAIRSAHTESIEQSSGFGRTSEKAFESPRSSGRRTDSSVESSNMKKSNTTPVLTRQRSFDSSYKKSIRVTSLGSSMEDPEINPPGFMREESLSSKSSSNVGGQDQGSFVSMSASNQADFSSVGTSGGVIKSSTTNQSSYSVSSQHGTQSSVLIRSESQSSYTDVNQSSRAQNINQSNLANQFPQMLEEMDVNESCLGIASHQNLSNEMKEMMQEQMKDHAGVLSPLDEIVPFTGLTSPLSRRSFFDTDHPLAGFDMESSLEIPADVQSIDLPEVHIQYLSEGPTVTATPTVLSQLGGAELPHVHHPIDNTVEEYQNAVNDDLERNLSGLSAFLPQHVSVCEPQEQYQSTNYEQSSVATPYNTDRSSAMHTHDTEDHAAGLEHMLIITPTIAPVITETPAPIMQDSMSSSSSSLFDSMSMSSSFTYPQSFDSRHYYSPRVNSLNIQGDLAPPPLEMIEVCKSSFVLSKASFDRKPPKECAEPVFNFQNENLKWQYPSLANENNVNEDKDRIGKGRQSNMKGNKGEISAERGEEKIVLDLRPSLKKGVTKSEQETKKKICSSKLQDMVDSDHGEFSGTEDEVFVDPSEVTADTTFFAAGSKYFQRRDFFSYGHFPGQEKLTGNNRSNASQTFTFEPPTRLSLDESMMQIVAHRHENTNSPESGLVQVYQDDALNTDVGPIDKEDIRFSKAHRSSKLLSLCEKFEGGSAQSLNSDDEDNSAKPKQITPPEKNIVASIRQMHESLELDKDVDGGMKPVRQRPVSHEGTKSPVDEIEYAESPVTSKDLSRFDPSSSGPKSPEAKSKDSQTPQGKPPKHRGKPRTLSESSLSENEGIKGSPKNTRVENLPKGKNEGSPKGQRNSLVSPDEGSPKLTPTKSSPKGQRYSTEISPKLGRTKDNVSVVPRHSISPQSVRSAEGSKIPVPKFTQSHREDGKSLSNGKTASSPKGSRNSTVSPNIDNSSRIGSKTKDSKQTVKHSENNGGQTKLTKDRDFPSRVHFDVKSPETKHDFRREKKIEDSAEKKKRRGSIKELTNVFEEKIENLSKQTQSQSMKQNQSPSSAQAKLRARVRSVSPSNSGAKPSQQLPTNMRHSLELPRKETEHASKGGDGTTRPHSVRMGPKPFYGAK